MIKIFYFVVWNLNNTSIFERVLIKENYIQTEVHFLDFCIHIIDNKFTFSINNKRDYFSFTTFTIINFAFQIFHIYFENKLLDEFLLDKKICLSIILSLLFIQMLHPVYNLFTFSFIGTLSPVRTFGRTSKTSFFYYIYYSTKYNKKSWRLYLPCTYYIRSLLQAAVFVIYLAFVFFLEQCASAKLFLF